MNAQTMGALQQDIREAWELYARPRWTPRMAAAMWALLGVEVRRQYRALHDAAIAYGGGLAFGEEELLLRALEELDRACEFCGGLYGVQGFGSVRRNPLRRAPGCGVSKTDFALDAYAVCCAGCAAAKTRFSDVEWRGVLAALAPCDDVARREALTLLAQPIARGKLSQAGERVCRHTTRGRPRRGA